MKHTLNLLIIWTILWACTAGSVVRGQVPAGFPYVGLVCENETFVRSGPGMDYYPTQRLPLNSTVEIYCELPTGWAAIRPPEGSYSWVRGQFLEQQPESGLGKILSDHVAAAVGSSVGDYRDVIQVRLKKDEPVAILEKTYYGSDVWYKIAPPSGEFRWINLSQVIPADPLRRTAGQNQKLLLANQLPPPPMNSGAPQSLNQIRSAVQAADPFYRSLSQLEQDWQALLLTNPAQWNVEPIMIRAENLRYSTENLEQRKQVDVLLNRMTQAREFARDAQLAQQRRDNGGLNGGLNGDSRRDPLAGNLLFAPSNSPVASDAGRGDGRGAGHRGEPNRGAADAYRPVRYDSSQYGSNQDGGDQYGEDRFDKLDRASQLERQYRLDGVGILAPLSSETVRRTSIRWALKDGQGQIRYYVSPSLGVRFQGLEGQVVGVTGSREYLPHDSRLHITVRNIRPLDNTARF